MAETDVTVFGLYHTRAGVWALLRIAMPLDMCQDTRSNKFAYFNNINSYVRLDRLCGLVVRVSGYRYRGPGFDPRRYQIF